MKTLIPAYNRDYTSAKTAKADFIANKDFILADFSSPYDGAYINRQDLNGEQVKIRYARLTKLVVTT